MTLPSTQLLALHFDLYSLVPRSGLNIKRSNIKVLSPWRRVLDGTFCVIPAVNCNDEYTLRVGGNYSPNTSVLPWEARDASMAPSSFGTEGL